MKEAPRIHALIIGVDRYLPPPDGGADGYFPNLKGAVRDAERVEAWLRRDWNIPPERIEKLLAPLAGGEPPECSPTYDNLVAAFHRLGERARTGDHVWIHYSGHGGRVPTRFPNLKLGDVDEALVPTDIGDRGARYLRDLELAYLLEDLADSGLRLTVVLDCCHAGGAFRHGHDEDAARRRRGTDHVDRTERPEQSLVAAAAELKRNWRRVRKSYRRSLEPAAGWHFEPRGYVLLAACRAREQAFEVARDGGPSGALTHWLLDSMRALPRQVTYRQVYERVRAYIENEDLGQTPQLEGEGDTLVLSAGTVDPSGGVTVMEVDREAGKVLLDAGEVHCARIGTRWAVHAPGTRDLDDAKAKVACLELVEVGAESSWAVAVGGDLERVELGASAVLLRRSSRRRGRIRTVRLERELSSMPEELEKLRQAVIADGFLEVLADDDVEEKADFAAAATGRGYEIFGGDGRRLDGLDPVPFHRDRAERHAAWNLFHLARFRDVQELANDDQASPLHGGLELILHRLPGPPSAGAVDPARLVALADEPELRAGDWLCLMLANRSNRVLNVALFDLRYSDWQIVKIFPARASFHSLEAGEEAFLPFRLERPEREMVKALGTLEATSFDSIQLPAIGRRGRRQYRALDFAGMDWTVCELMIDAARNGG